MTNGYSFVLLLDSFFQVTLAIALYPRQSLLDNLIPSNSEFRAELRSSRQTASNKRQNPNGKAVTSPVDPLPTKLRSLAEVTPPTVQAHCRKSFKIQTSQAHNISKLPVDHHHHLPTIPNSTH
jgi:hypothetical protein